MNVICKISALSAGRLINCCRITDKITRNNRSFIYDTTIIEFAWLCGVYHIHFNSHTKIINAPHRLNNMTTANSLNFCCITWNI